MCVLHVSGKTLDPDKELAASGLTPRRIGRAGEPRLRSKPDGDRLDHSTFSVDVSEASWSSLVDQVNDAVAFLKTHYDTLKSVRTAPGVEDMRLDFPLDLRIDREKVFAQFDYLPPELISLAGALGLGIEISIYPKDLEQLARKRAKKRKR